MNLSGWSDLVLLVPIVLVIVTWFISRDKNNKKLNSMDSFMASWAIINGAVS